MSHSPSRLLLLVSCQQSILATPADIDRAVATVYTPMLDALAAAPSQRLALHFNGYLLDRLARAHEGFLLRLQSFVAAGQVEVLGGLFYGGPPSLLPENDLRGQVAMLSEFWASFVGHAPRGLYLPELAWTPELPRLLEDTGIAYAFAGTAQLAPPAFLSRIERGGLPLVTFGLDTALSLAYRPGEEAAFVRRAVAGRADNAPVGLYLAAERLALPPTDAAEANAAGPVGARLRALFQALLTEGAETYLPAAFLQAPPKLPASEIVRGYAPWYRPLDAQTAAVQDWAAFPGGFAEAQVIYRRMLRASARLGEAIAQMEDQNLDSAWSDALATAQRLIFAAQSSEVLGSGEAAGVFNPAVRQAALARIMDAEGLLDTLQHGHGPFLQVHEGDIDNDLQPDVLVQSPAMTAWVQPGRGGAVRALDHRSWRLNVLDAGTRRPQPEAGAPEDMRQRRGLFCAWFAADADMDACVRGQAHDLLQATAPTGVPTGAHAGAWQLEEGAHRLDAASAAPLPASVCVRQKAEADLGAYGHWQLVHQVEVPAEGFALSWQSHWRRQGNDREAVPSRWALEVPLFLGDGPLALSLAGRQLTAGSHELANGAALHVAGPSGQLTLTAHCPATEQAPFTLWYVPLEASRADVGAPERAHLGASVWITRPVGSGAQVTVDIREASASPTR